MPNTFIDNREAWLRLSEIDYLGQFVKVWLAFNAWYRSAYSEKQDRKIINELKWNSNPIGNALRPLLENASEKAEQLRSDIGLLHHRLEHYEIITAKGQALERVTFRNVYLRDRPASVETYSSYGSTFRVERKTNGAVECEVLNKQGTAVFLVQQQKYDLSEIESHADFLVISSKQRTCLRELYIKSSPREVADLLATQGNGPIKCGAFSFHCGREELFAAVVEVVYLLRCHLFHGELSPTKQASECYEPAYRIVRRFLEHVS